MQTQLLNLQCFGHIPKSIALFMLRCIHSNIKMKNNRFQCLFKAHMCTGVQKWLYGTKSVQKAICRPLDPIVSHNLLCVHNVMIWVMVMLKHAQLKPLWIYHGMSRKFKQILVTVFARSYALNSNETIGIGINNQPCLNYHLAIQSLFLFSVVPDSFNALVVFLCVLIFI